MDEEHCGADLCVVGSSIRGDSVLVDPNGSRFSFMHDVHDTPSSMFRPTLRGLTSGSVAVQDQNSLAPCILFGGASCSWLPVVEQLGYRAVGVLLTSDHGLSYVRACVPAGCRILVCPQWSRLDALPFPGPPGTVAFLDCRFTGLVARLLESVGVRDAITTRGLRRITPGWVSSMTSISHATVGGVTSSVVSVTRVRFGSTVVPGRAVPSVVGRDASTILSSTTYCRRFWARPDARVLVPLRTEFGVSGRVRYYHGGGLLPAGASTSTWILAPHVRAPPGRWGLRPLTFEEVLLAHDFNSSHCRLLMPLPDGVRHALRPSLYPLRCLLYGCQSFDLGLRGDGGVKFLLPQLLLLPQFLLFLKFLFRSR